MSEQTLKQAYVDTMFATIADQENRLAALYQDPRFAKLVSLSCDIIYREHPGIDRVTSGLADGLKDYHGVDDHLLNTALNTYENCKKDAQ